jgi:putative ABC transport system permease protein
MSSPRWSKVFHDLWDHKGRSLIVILTIMVGVFAVGFVGDMFFITLPDLDRNYQVANPHGAIIYTSPFDNDLLPSLKKVDGVGDVEGRGSLAARVRQPGGDWATIQFATIPPINEMVIDKLRPQIPGGTIPPLGEKEVYLERSSGNILGVNPGDLITIELPDGSERQLRVASFVFDVTSPPYLFGQSVYAYTNPDTLVWLGESRNYNTVYLTVNDDKRNEKHVRDIAEAVGSKIEASGRQVYFILILSPGRHFASDITAALGSMMMILGLLAVLVSAFLVINMLNALLNQQIRQIGVMKAVGARTGQIAGMYLLLTLVFGLVALVIAIPLGAFISNATGGQIPKFLNFDPSPFRIAPQGVILEAFIALVIPVLAALFPVFRGARVTVREAITDYGMGRGAFGKSLIDRVIEKIQGLPRPLLISFRNTFRRKGRLFLTLTALVLAGGIFMGVYNTRAALNIAIEDTLGYILTDVNVGFSRPYRIQRVMPVVMNMPGVVKAEAWGGALASVMQPDLATGTQIQILAPPADSNLIEASMIEGRWLVPQDENALVIGRSLLAARPELKVGDTVTVDIDGNQRPWEIVGVYRFVGNQIPPLVYANNDYLSTLTHSQNMATSLRIVTDYHSGAYQKQIGRNLTEAFRKEGIIVSQAVLGSDLISANTSTTDVLIFFLLVMGVLIAIVGGLGMTSTMGLNVFERTREVGVMRAVGASNGTVFQIVMAEGLFVGVISSLLSALVSIPIGWILGVGIGISLTNTPLNFAFSWTGFIYWLILVLVISTLASILPARNAVRLTVRETLVYE